jgi:hypothetical protein
MCIRQISQDPAYHASQNYAPNPVAQFVLTALRTATILAGITSFLHGITTANPISLFIACICVIVGFALFSIPGEGAPSVVLVDPAPPRPWYSSWHHTFRPSFFSFPSFYAPPLPTYHRVSPVIPSYSPPISFASTPTYQAPSYQTPSYVSPSFALPSFDLAARGTLGSRSYESAALPFGGYNAGSGFRGDFAQRGTLRSRG